MNVALALPEASEHPNSPKSIEASRSARGVALFAALFLVGGAVIGVVADRAISSRTTNAAANEIPGYGTGAKPGPWGEMYSFPFTISAPEESLPVRVMEETGARWVFPGWSGDDIQKLLLRADASTEEREALLSASVLHETQGSVELTPPTDRVLSLSPKVRQAIYERAAQFEENRDQLLFIHRDSLRERFDGSGVADSTVQLFKRLSWESGEYYVFSGMAALLSRLPTYQEKLSLLKGLTRQKTLMVRIHIKPGSDLGALAKYWGKGCWSTDIHTVLDSVAHATGGTWINLVSVLPPVPASELYFYPVVQDNPMNGPPVVRDCHWSSLNFFRDAPDPNFARPGYAAEQFKANYYPIFGDPRYGDLLTLIKADGTMIHSAVYIADDIVFTKNGSTVLYPWMLSTVSDILKQYAYEAGPNEKLKVIYYRNKAL